MDAYRRTRARAGSTPRLIAPLLYPALLAVAGLLLAAGAHARPADPRWAAIRAVFHQGETEGPYFRIDLPRTDLHVRIGNDVLDPRFEFTSYAGFVPLDHDRVMAMGEVVLRADEVPAVLAEADRQGVRISAVHNHLLGETPRIVYVHYMTEGPAAAVANRLRAVYGRSATPLAPPRKEPASADWSSIDAVLGRHAEAEGRVAEYEFPRKELIRVGGMAVRSTGALETGSEVVFQKLDARRDAVTGELHVLPGEVDPVVRALVEHGLQVTAVHNHMVDDAPRMYWIHWYATGDGPALARGVAAALARTNSERRSSR